MWHYDLGYNSHVNLLFASITSIRFFLTLSSRSVLQAVSLQTGHHHHSPSAQDFLCFSYHRIFSSWGEALFCSLQHRAQLEVEHGDELHLGKWQHPTPKIRVYFL